MVARRHFHVPARQHRPSPLLRRRGTLVHRRARDVVFLVVLGPMVGFGGVKITLRPATLGPQAFLGYFPAKESATATTKSRVRV